MRKLFSSQMITYITGFSCLIVSIGCAQGYCYNRGDNSKGASTALGSAHTGKRVFVFQQDGTRQCSKTPGISVEDMATKLKGIKIYSKEKKSDGKMHIALCGSPTDMINVYEIDEADLLRAKEAQFEEYKSEF